MFKMMRREVAPQPEELVREHAMRRLSTVFRIPMISLTSEMRFGQELKAAPVSDFKANEFDIIDDDIKGVADIEDVPIAFHPADFMRGDRRGRPRGSGATRPPAQRPRRRG